MKEVGDQEDIIILIHFIKRVIMIKTLSFKVFGLLLILFFFTSCSVYQIINAPKGVKMPFRDCCNNDITNTDSSFKINGYYETRTYFNMFKDTDEIETYNDHYMVFYKDGTVVANFWHFNAATVKQYLSNIVKELKSNRKIGYYRWGTWGTYKLINDTVKIMVCEKSTSLNTDYSLYVMWYKIINDSTLKDIKYRQLYPNNYEIVFDAIHLVGSKRNPLTHFHAFDSIPPSRPWIKNRKWFWCNKEDYKKYKQEQKTIRKNEKN